MQNNKERYKINDMVLISTVRSWLKMIENAEDAGDETLEIVKMIEHFLIDEEKRTERPEWTKKQVTP